MKKWTQQRSTWMFGFVCLLICITIFSSCDGSSEEESELFQELESVEAKAEAGESIDTTENTIPITDDTSTSTETDTETSTETSTESSTDDDTTSTDDATDDSSDDTSTNLLDGVSSATCGTPDTTDEENSSTVLLYISSYLSQTIYVDTSADLDSPFIKVAGGDIDCQIVLNSSTDTSTDSTVDSSSVTELYIALARTSSVLENDPLLTITLDDTVEQVLYLADGDNEDKEAADLSSIQISNLTTETMIVQGGDSESATTDRMTRLVTEGTRKLYMFGGSYAFKAFPEDNSFNNFDALETEISLSASETGISRNITMGNLTIDNQLSSSVNITVNGDTLGASDGCKCGLINASSSLIFPIFTAKPLTDEITIVAQNTDTDVTYTAVIQRKTADSNEDMMITLTDSDTPFAGDHVTSTEKNDPSATDSSSDTTDTATEETTDSTDSTDSTDESTTE